MWFQINAAPPINAEFGELKKLINAAAFNRVNTVNIPRMPSTDHKQSTFTPIIPSAEIDKTQVTVTDIPIQDGADTYL